MIDTHCHLLPGLDDGPQTASEAMKLARGLTEAGVHTVVCTPHFSRRFPTRHEHARAAFERLAVELERAGIPLRLRLSAEISSAAAVEAPAEELTRRRFGPHHLLVELESDAAAGVVGVVVARLLEIGLVPVIAHPERCRAVRAQPRVLDSAREAGALVQVVAPSLTGRWGSEASAAAWSMLEHRRADLIASDAHKTAHAGPALRAALDQVGARFGARALAELTEHAPSRLLEPRVMA